MSVCISFSPKLTKINLQTTEWEFKRQVSTSRSILLGSQSFSLSPSKIDNTVGVRVNCLHWQRGRERRLRVRKRASPSEREWDPHSQRAREREKKKNKKNEKKWTTNKTKKREYDERTLWIVVTNHAKK